jgi:hypothetical protein
MSASEGARTATQAPTEEPQPAAAGGASRPTVSAGSDTRPGRWRRPPGWAPLPPAYWGRGWELRHLDWLRWHGLLWPPGGGR